MFKEEYKQHYDKIHPSQELIEKTKKLAIEQYQQSLKKDINDVIEEIEENEEQFETMELEEEKIVPFVSRRNIIRIVGGIAAGVAIIVSGFYFGNTLQQEEKYTSDKVTEKATPKVVSEIQNTPSTMEEQEEDRETKKETKKKTKEKQVKKSEPSDLTKMATMSRSGGVKLDYVSGDTVIFHGNFGIIIYSLSGNNIVENISGEEYILSGSWETETVQVSADGSRICWYNTLSSARDNAKIYDRNTKTIESVNEAEWTEAVFSGVQGVSGSIADVYKSSCSGGTMVSLGANVYQLMYQAPSSGIHASLAVSVINLETKSETLHSVFGTIGKDLVGSGNYGGYHNENGEKLFAKEEQEESEQPEETAAPSEQEIVVEPTPVETKTPDEKETKTEEPVITKTEEPVVQEENIEE